MWERLQPLGDITKTTAYSFIVVCYNFFLGLFGTTSSREGNHESVLEDSYKEAHWEKAGDMQTALMNALGDDF